MTMRRCTFPWLEEGLFIAIASSCGVTSERLIGKVRLHRTVLTPAGSCRTHAR